MKHWLWLTLLLTANAYAADWKLDPASSEIIVTSVKKDQIAEHHQFKNFSGTLRADGSFNIDIDLNSLETNIPIRNERMQKYLFETNQFPKATLSGVCNNCLKELKQDTPTAVVADAELSLHGKSQQLKLALTLVKTADAILVSSRQPVMVNTFTFGLADGVKKLQQIAGLPRIDFSVPVTFTTVWKK